MTTVAQTPEEARATGEHDGDPSLRATGWALLVSLLGLVLAWTFGILWLTSGGVFGPLSDVSSMVYNLPLLVVALGLYRLSRERTSSASLAVLAVGVLGVTVSVVAGVGLTLADVGAVSGVAGTALAAQRVGGLLTGLWVLAVSVQEVSLRAFDRRVGLAGIVAGLGGTVVGVALLLGGTGHPAFGIGAVVQFLGTVVWAVWLARRCLSGTFRRPAGTPSDAAPPA